VPHRRISGLFLVIVGLFCSMNKTGYLWSRNFIFSRQSIIKPTGRRLASSRDANRTKFKYGSLVTAVVTHRWPPPSCRHMVLREGGCLYTDVGKITHEALTELHDGSVVEIGEKPVTCQALFHKTTREEFIDFRISRRTNASRRSVHPNDLLSLCSIIGVQAGSRVLEVGSGYGHLTILLSDLVGDSGHVIATSKGPFPALVKEAVAEWLGRDGFDKDLPSERYTNVTLHAVDVEDQLSVKCAMSSALSSKHLVENMDSVLPITSSLDCSSNLLDAATIVRMPEETTRRVIESVFPLMKLGGAIGVVPLDFDHLRSISDYIHERQLPLYLDMVRQPERHGFFHTLEQAQNSIEEESSSPERDDGDDIDEIAIDETNENPPCSWPWPWPHQRLFWSRRQGYNEVWIAKLVKVSSYKFVAEAEIPMSAESIQEEVDRKRLLVEEEVEEKFKWTKNMEMEIDRRRKAFTLSEIRNLKSC